LRIHQQKDHQITHSFGSLLQSFNLLGLSAAARNFGFAAHNSGLLGPTAKS